MARVTISTFALITGIGSYMMAMQDFSNIIGPIQCSVGIIGLPYTEQTKPDSASLLDSTASIALVDLRTQFSGKLRCLHCLAYYCQCLKKYQVTVEELKNFISTEQHQKTCIHKKESPIWSSKKQKFVCPLHPHRPTFDTRKAVVKHWSRTHMVTDPRSIRIRSFPCFPCIGTSLKEHKCILESCFFPTQTLYDSHMYIQHRELYKKKILSICPICIKKFNRSKDLTGHLRNDHADQFSDSNNQVVS